MGLVGRNVLSLRSKSLAFFLVKSIILSLTKFIYFSVKVIMLHLWYVLMLDFQCLGSWDLEDCGLGFFLLEKFLKCMELASFSMHPYWNYKTPEFNSWEDNCKGYIYYNFVTVV